MADKHSKKSAEKTAHKPAAGANTTPQYGVQILTQYVRDMSFENPNAPESLLSGWGAPETNIQVSINTRPMKDDLHEIVLMFKIEAVNKDKNKAAFIVELTYAATAQLKNVPDEHVQPILMVEMPKLMFPFAREIIANASVQGGYPPLYLQPINFEAIFIAEAKRRLEDKKAKGAAG